MLIYQDLQDLQVVGNLNDNWELGDFQATLMRVFSPQMTVLKPNFITQIELETQLIYDFCQF